MAFSKKVTFIIDAQDNASSKFKSLQKQTSSLTSGMALIGKGAVAAATGILALGSALGVAGGFAVKSAAEYEQNRIAFDTMLGSADRARQMLKELSDFAMKTPFELPEVVTGAKQLLAYSIEADKLIPTFNALGNIAAGVGKDKLPQLVLAFGQVKAATKLTGMELRQFTEAGVPLLEILAKQSGKTAAQVKEDMEGGAAPSFEEVEKAIFSMSQEGGKFFNLMDRQSKTFSGIMSNIKDDIGRVAREIIGINDQGDIREGSIFFYLKNGAQNFYRVLDENKDKIISTIQGAINFVIGLAQGWREARDAVAGFFSETNYVWVFIRDFLTPVITSLRDTFKQSWNEIVTAIQPIKPELKIVAEFFGIVIVGAIMAIILILAELIKMGVKVTTGLITAFSGFIQWFENGWTAMILFLTGNFSAGMDSAKKSFSGLVSFIKGLANVIFAPIIYAMDQVKKAWDSLTSYIKKNPISAVIDIVQKIKKKVTGKAAGGPVTGGTPYIVGEVGPELFIPNSSGTIVPNNQLATGGSNFTFNFQGAVISDKLQLITEIKQAINRELELSRYGIG